LQELEIEFNCVYFFTPKSIDNYLLGSVNSHLPVLFLSADIDDVFLVIVMRKPVSIVRLDIFLGQCNSIALRERESIFLGIVA
jgi:hypothetical protein